MVAISVEYSTEIEAEAQKLWDIMADIEAWPEWQGTPFVNVETPLPIKEDSAFEAKLGGARWRLTVRNAERPSKLIWTAKATGLKAVHEWEFNERDGKTVVTTRESVSGWMAMALYFLVRASLRSSNEKWLADLKARAESS